MAVSCSALSTAAPEATTTEQPSPAESTARTTGSLGPPVTQCPCVGRLSQLLVCLPRPEHLRSSALSDGTHLDHFGDIVTKHVLDACLQGRRRTRTPRTCALHVEIDHTVFVVVKNDVAPVLGHRGAHARFEQFLDLRNHFVFVFGPGFR